MLIQQKQIKCSGFSLHASITLRAHFIQVKLSKRKHNSNVQIRLTTSAYHSWYDLPYDSCDDGYITRMIFALQYKKRVSSSCISKDKSYIKCTAYTAFTECVFACTKQFVINANRRQGARIYVTISLWDGYFRRVLLRCITLHGKK